MPFTANLVAVFWLPLYIANCSILSTLSELAVQEKLVVWLERVASECNKADQLTRVPKKWLVAGLAVAGVTAMGRDLQLSKQEMVLIHSKHYFGVDQILELVCKRFASVDCKTVKEAIFYFIFLFKLSEDKEDKEDKEEKQGGISRGWGREKRLKVLR